LQKLSYKDIGFFQKLGMALPPGHLYNKIMKFLDPTRRFFLQKLSYKDIDFFQKLGMALQLTALGCVHPLEMLLQK